MFWQNVDHTACLYSLTVVHVSPLNRLRYQARNASLPLTMRFRLMRNNELSDIVFGGHTVYTNLLRHRGLHNSDRFTMMTGYIGIYTGTSQKRRHKFASLPSFRRNFSFGMWHAERENILVVEKDIQCSDAITIVNYAQCGFFSLYIACFSQHLIPGISFENKRETTR